MPAATSTTTSGTDESQAQLRHMPIPFYQAKEQTPAVLDSVSNVTGGSTVDEELEGRLDKVNEQLKNPEYRAFLENLERLGTLYDMTRYGVSSLEQYLPHSSSQNPPILQTESLTRETTFPSNLDCQYDGKGYQELLRRRPSAGLGYKERSDDISPESNATPQEKEQFDFARSTPHKERIKYRNIIGPEGQVVDVTGVEAADIRVSFE